MLEKGPSRHRGVGRGAVTHLLALLLGLALIGSVVYSNLGLGLPGYFGGSASSSIGGRRSPARLPGTYAEWLPTVMPPSLLPEYAPPGALPFNLTMSILRRTRPVVGNTERVRGFLRKLRGGTCTVSLMLGGSVTAGHNGGGREKAYVREEWLIRQI